MMKNEHGKKFLNILKRAGKGLLAFCKVNYLMCGYIVAALIIELTAVAVTSGRFYMTEPWLFLSFVVLGCLISQFLPGHKSRYVLFLVALIVNFVLDMIFIVVYNSTGGTIFDYAMFNLRNDAVTIMEKIPFSFTHVFVSAVLLAVYATLGLKYTKKMPKPNAARSSIITTATLTALVLSTNAMTVYLTNDHYDSNDLNYKLHQNETGTYSNKGIVGNFYNELIRGLFFSKIDFGDENELRSFIYGKTTQPTPLTGKADGFNVVTILCESFEWFTFLYDEAKYPNGFARSVTNGEMTEAEVQQKLRELYPNFYRIY